MVITVEDDLQTQLELLWIREAWQLSLKGEDLPPLLVYTPPVVATQRSGAPVIEWQDAWPRGWAAVLQHAGTTRDPEIFERLHASASGSKDRARLLRELVGTSCQEEVGAEAITDELQQWMGTQFEHRVADCPDWRHSPSTSRSRR
jgi:hypothetical protein